MLNTLITSKTRINLLLKFFLNPGTKAYLRELAAEFDESTNSVRVELNRLTDAKLLKSANLGRKIIYRANSKHNLFQDIQNVVRKFVGLDQLVEDLIKRLGTVDKAFVIGDYARGIDSGLIDVVLVGYVFGSLNFLRSFITLGQNFFPCCDILSQHFTEENVVYLKEMCRGSTMQETWWEHHIVSLEPEFSSILCVEGILFSSL